MRRQWTPRTPQQMEEFCHAQFLAANVLRKAPKHTCAMLRFLGDKVQVVVTTEKKASRLTAKAANKTKKDTSSQ